MAFSAENNLAIALDSEKSNPMSFCHAALKHNNLDASISVAMSASLKAIAWCSQMGLPNDFLSLEYR